MKPQKFLAPNVTEALKLVTQQLGGDAIVLTTRDTAQGVEIIAITPGDLAQLSDSRMDPTGRASASAPPVQAVAAAVAPSTPTPAP